MCVINQRNELTKKREEEKKHTEVLKRKIKISTRKVKQNVIFLVDSNVKAKKEMR